MRGQQILITGPRRAELAPLDLPTDDRGPAEAVVRTSVTLLSGGTEGALFQGLPVPGRARPPFPYPVGYANVGEVIAAGPAAGVAPGALVYTMGRHASLVRVDAARRPCVPVPDGLPPEEAAFARLLTVPLTTLRIARARAGDRAAVVGLGIVGNLGAQLLREAGMAVTAVDLVAERRALAARCGIARVIDPREEGALRPEHRLVLEATGTARGTVTALALARPGGEVSLVGTPWVADPAVPASAILEPIHLRYITVLSGWEWQLPIHGAGDEPSGIHQPGTIVEGTVYAFALLREGRERVRDLITHHVAPGDCQAAYEGAIDRQAEQLGAIFRWAA